VRVTAACGRLQLKVTDDGQGFELRPAGTAPGGERLGLPGMAERAELVGGSLEVCSAPGEGTTVTLTVPAGAPRVQPPRSGGVSGMPSGGAG
jgi:signal transduction histidine kinase